MSDSDFYIGYQQRTNPALGRLLRRLVLGLLFGTAVGAALLPTLQAELDRGVFEFGVVRTFEGILSERPYPRLLVERAGAALPSSLYLVSFGKHGANPAVQGLDGQHVRLRGSLIYRDDQTMLELADGSIEHLPHPASLVEAVEPFGTHTLQGEIVDSKCYLGVMKPGRQKPHRACASLCIRGGIPPLLRVESADGTIDHLLLVGSAGQPIGGELLSLVAEPVQVTGIVERRGELLVLLADADAFHRLGD